MRGVTVPGRRTLLLALREPLALWVAPAGVVLAACAAGWLVYTRLVLPSGPLSWDESAHALYGLLIAYDIETRDWLSLAYDTYRQVFWPPLHSWLTAVVFLAAGVSDIHARLGSVFAYALLPPILYLAGRRLGGPRGEVSGIVAAGLAMTSPIVQTWAAQCMLDVPALVPFCATLLVWFQLVDSDAPPRRFTWVGLLILATYFARTNYAILLAAAIGLSEATAAGFRFQRLYSARNRYLALPLVAGLALWFAYPPKLAATWAALVNISPNPEETFTRQGLLFYPRAFFFQSASPWLFALYVTAFLWGICRRGEERVRALLILILLQLILGEFHHSKASRYILPAFPAMFLLAGYLAAGWWDVVGKALGKRWRWLGRVGPPALLVVLLAHATERARQAEPFVRPHYEAAAALSRALAVVFGEAQPTMLLGTWDLKLIPPIDWGLAGRERAVSVAQAGFVGQAAQRRALRAAVKGLQLPPGWMAGTLGVLDRADQPGRNLTRYTGSGEPASVTGLAAELARPDLRQLIVLTSIDERAALPLSVFEPALAGAGWQRASSMLFPAIRIRADSYRR
jgi:4-amino-4-deoxy-L-arabinose transferase-like glycosyltransferase